MCLSCCIFCAGEHTASSHPTESSRRLSDTYKPWVVDACSHLITEVFNLPLRQDRVYNHQNKLMQIGGHETHLSRLRKFKAFRKENFPIAKRVNSDQIRNSRDIVLGHIKEDAPTWNYNPNLNDETLCVEQADIERETGYLRRIDNLGNEIMQDRRPEVRVLGDDANPDNIAWVAAQDAHLAEIGAIDHERMQDQRLEVKVFGDDADANNIGWVAAQDAHLATCNCKGAGTYDH